MKKGLSIVIVNYFSESYIIPLVYTITSTINIKNYEILIVSNSPSAFEWDCNYLDKHHIIIFENSSNEGFGRAVNRGVEYSKYDYFCMINPDIDINRDTLDKLYLFFNTLEDKVGAISCMIKNSDGTMQNSFFMNRGLTKKSFFLLYLSKLIPSKILNYMRRDKNIKQEIDLSKPFEVGGFYASFVMMRKSAFIEVGGFDRDFFMYAEDVDLFRTRFIKRYKSIFYPFVELTHFSGKTDKYGLMEHQAQVSYLLYLRKVGGYYLFVYVFLLSIKYSLLLLISLLLNKKAKKEEAFGFFKSLKYLKIILKYPKGYSSMPNALKIDEIKD